MMDGTRYSGSLSRAAKEKGNLFTKLFLLTFKRVLLHSITS
jgi:hypothetical protein